MKKISGFYWLKLLTKILKKVGNTWSKSQKEESILKNYYYILL